MTGEAPRLLALHDDDNVLVALGPTTPGEATTSAGETVDVRATVTLGHKIARRDIRVGEAILKYGVPIGEATQAISAGEHVHVQNMRSRYTATHALEETAGGGGHA